MSDLTFLKPQGNRAVGLFFFLCLYLLSGFCVSAGLKKEEVSVAGKSFLIELPNGLCAGSETDWGIEYKKYLLELGIAAGGRPAIVSVVADCNFVASAKKENLPATWGYIAFDKNVGKYWFGQKSLNKRMRKEIEKLQLEKAPQINLEAITNDALKKMRAKLSVGEITHLGKSLENEEGFLVSALARFISGEEVFDVFLTTVTFIRNRQIITFAVYEGANGGASLGRVRLIGEQFLKSLSD